MSIDPISLAITVALTAGSMALQASQKIEGPRVTDLKGTTADYGTQLAYFKGIRRMECPCFFAEDIKEVKKKRKTKGGKYNDYTYFGTFAVVIADHLIENVTRIWFDRHLVYDATGVGPYSIFALQDDYELPNAMRIYKGTEDQMPDPRMLATIEAKDGVDTCPAYRGVAYIMFEDIPLEKLGNRFPQVSVEAVTVSDPVYPYETFSPQPPGMYHLTGFTYSPDFSRFVAGTSDYEVWDVAARAKMTSGTFPDSTFGVGISNTGTCYGIGRVADGTYGLWSVALDHAVFGTAYPIAIPQDKVYVKQDGNGVEHLLTTPWSFYTTWYSETIGGVGGVAPHETFDETGYYWQPKMFLTDSYGDIWAVGSTPNVIADIPDYIYFQRVVDTGVRPGTPSFTRIAAPDPGSNYGSQVQAVHYNGHFIVGWANSALYKIDDETFDIVDTYAYGPDVYNGVAQFANVKPGSSSIWLGFNEFSLDDLSLIRTVNPFDWKVEDGGGVIYDPINNALICGPQFIDVITWRYLDRIGSNGVQLRSIVDDLHRRVRLPTALANTTALTQIVRGFSWTQGVAKTILTPLLELHDVDPRTHDFGVEYVNRGGASTGTLNTEWFVRTGDGGNRYDVTISNDTDLPRRLFLNFADVDGDQQPNSALAQRTADSVGSDRDVTIDMTSTAMSPDEAQPLVERLMRRRWFEKFNISNALTPMELRLELADVKDLELDGKSIGARVIKQRIAANGVLDLEWVNDSPGIASLSASEGAPAAGRPASAIAIPGITKGFVFDIPMVNDAHDQTNPFLYIAAAPFSDTTFWPGADYMVSDDGSAGTYVSGWDAIAGTDAVTWGQTQEALGDATPAVIDNGNTLAVTMNYGDLESVTEDEALADPLLNLVLIGSPENGWELVQVITATLTGAKQYTLSGFLRGVRGTEQFTGTHQIGDAVVLVSSLVKKHSVSASSIGDTAFIKPITQGRSEGSGVAQELVFSAASLKPLSPVDVQVTRTGNVWGIDWLRRTRIGGNMIDGRDVPLGETSEAYEVDIYDGATVVRTIAVTSSVASYTEAQQIADFGTVQDYLTVAVYQMSPVLDIRGFPTFASGDVSGGPGRYRFWRFRSTTTSTSNFLGIAELNARSVSGGFNLSAGKTVTASTVIAGYPTANAVDGDIATFWTTGGTTAPAGGHWVYVDFGEETPRQIVEVAITNRPTGIESPLDLYVEYSTDAYHWTQAWYEETIAAWGGSETKTFTAPYA